MKAVIGLGNPGKEYAKTKHNTGWMFLEYLEDKYHFKIDKKENDSMIAKTQILQKPVIFVKPQTFMNLSGNAVLKIKNWYKLENEEILIVFDDVDIPFGSVRFKQKGSGGTHNGMKNIVSMLNSQDIPRIRIGTGNLKKQDQNLIDFVLEPYSKDEIIALKDCFGQAEQKMLEFLDNA